MMMDSSLGLVRLIDTGGASASRELLFDRKGIPQALSGFDAHCQDTAIVREWKGKVKDAKKKGGAVLLPAGFRSGMALFRQRYDARDCIPQDVSDRANK
jgi:hypothetical protein